MKKTLIIMLFCAATMALAAHRGLIGLLLHGLLHTVAQGVDLGVGTTGGNDKILCQRRQLCHLDGADLLAFLLIQCLYGDQCQFLSSHLHSSCSFLYQLILPAHFPALQVLQGSQAPPAGFPAQKESLPAAAALRLPDPAPVRRRAAVSPGDFPVLSPAHPSQAVLPFRIHRRAVHRPRPFPAVPP